MKKENKEFILVMLICLVVSSVVILGGLYLIVNYTKLVPIIILIGSLIVLLAGALLYLSCDYVSRLPEPYKESPDWYNEEKQYDIN